MESLIKQIVKGSLAVWLVFFLLATQSAPVASVWTPKATTSENNTLPTGLALADNVTANLTYQTTQPTGTVAPTARTGDGSEVTTQPTGSVTITPRDNTGSETNTQPSGSVSVNALTGDGSEVTTQPTGSVTITPRDNTGAENTAVINGAVTIVANTVQASENSSSQTGIPAPTAYSIDGTLSTTQYTGVPASSAVAIQLSEQGGIGSNEPAGVGYANDAENKWYTGTWNFRGYNISIIVDDNSTGVFDRVYINCDDDASWAEDPTDNLVGYTAGIALNDEISNVPTQTAWGEAVGNRFTFDNIRFEDKIDSTATPAYLYIRSDSWVVGDFQVDLDNDSVADTLYYVIADNNSNGLLDGVYLSADNDYDDGNLSDDLVSADGTNDENVKMADVGVRSITLGNRYKFKVTTLHENAQLATVTSDIAITVDNYYTGQASIDIDGDGTTDVVNFCFVDENSDGIYENLYISAFDDNYEEGDLADDGISSDNDERLITSKNMRMGSYLYSVQGPRENSPGDVDDFSAFSLSRWYGNIYLDVDGNGSADNVVYLCLSDNDSNGVFNVLEISVNDNTFGEGTITDDNAYPADDALITTTGNIRIGTSAAQQYRYQATLVGHPAGTALAYDFRLTSTCWYTGTLSIDVGGDGTTDSVNFCLSDGNSDGVFDNLDISSDDTTYGEGTLTDSDAYTDDDVLITAAENVRIGTSASQSYNYEAAAPVGNPIGTSPDYSVTSTSWWTGVITIDVNGDGTLDNVYFALSDNDSNGIFNVLEISSDDNTFGEGTLTDNNAYTDDDVLITATDNIRIGTSTAQQYRYQATLVGNPAGTALAHDFRLTSTCWYTGTLSVDINDDGTADTVYFCLSDSGSDGVFDNLDISGDATYGQGTLNDNKVSTTGGVTEDERADAAISLFKFGDTNQFSLIAPVGNPIATTPDFSVTSKSWYAGTVQVEMTGDSTKDNLYICLLDSDSNNVFDNYYLSAFNDTFGQGTSTDNLIADDLSDNNDERLDAATDNLLIGPQQVRYDIFAPVANPQAQTVDFKMRTKSWYVGTITLHASNTFNFVILDENTDGVFDNLVFDVDGNGSYAGETHYSSYPTYPVYLSSSPYAYKVVWFNRNPAYSDATYGAYDLVMQPLDTASPTFSVASPTSGSITNDTTPTISVNLSDVATDSYTFGIESIVMKVRGQTVSHTYSGGVVSYTPSGLSDGVVEVSVTASDYAQNSASTSWSFTIDTTWSTLTLSPSLGATETATGWKLTTSLASIEISGSVSDATSVTVKINGEVVSVVGNSFSKSVYLVGGVNTFTITAVDAAGNTTVRTLSVTRTGAEVEVPPIATPAPSQGLAVFIGALGAVIIILMVLVKRALVKKRQRRVLSLISCT